MKKIMIIAAICSILLTGLITGCSAIVITPGGPPVTNEYSFTDFNSVQIGGPFEAKITYGNTYRVAITANEDLMKYIDISKPGDILKIKTQPLSLIGNHVLKAEITLPKLASVEFSGGCRGEVSGFTGSSDTNVEASGGSLMNINMTTGDINLEASGGSQINGDIKSNMTSVDLSGGSQCKITGTGGQTNLVASGGSGADLSDFNAAAVKANLSAGSHASVKTAGRLDVDASAGSWLRYAGNPSIGDIDISGGASIQHD